MAWFTVRVPASSANLGPGFDSLGLALGVYLTCRFRRSESLAIRAEGRDAAQISTAADNMIWQTAVAVGESLHLPMPPIELEIRNQIPLGKGMGSSAAALTGSTPRSRAAFHMTATVTRLMIAASALYASALAAIEIGAIT